MARRNDLQKMTMAERAITEAMWEIEKMGADDRLTKAQNLLSDARALVADCVDGKPITPTGPRGEPRPIYHQRVAAGITLRELAAKLGWTPERLSDLEWARSELTKEDEASIRATLEQHSYSKAVRLSDHRRHASQRRS